MKKTTILATTGAVVLVAGMLIPSAVMAADDSGDTFIDRVAERLGVSSAELETAMSDTRVELKEERDEAIEEAYDNGDLTDKQYEILQVQQAAREEMMEEREPGEKPEKGDFVEALAELGIEVTEEELQELRSTMEELGLGGQGPRGGRGMGMHR